MQKKFVTINNKVENFNKKINIDGDKSLSIRWALIASQAIGISKAKNLLKSDDVQNTLDCLKKLGVKIVQKNNLCTIEVTNKSAAWPFRPRRLPAGAFLWPKS